MKKTEQEKEVEAKKLFNESEGANMDLHTFIHAFKLGYLDGFDDGREFKNPTKKQKPIK